jgi:hypothetical protein
MLINTKNVAKRYFLSCMMQNPKLKNYMKKILFSVIFLAIAGSASAQLTKGAYYIGGSTDYNYDSSPASMSTTSFAPYGTTYYYTKNRYDFQLAPDFGIFLTNKWAVGIQLGYTRDGGTEVNNYVASNTQTESYIRIDNYHTQALGIGLHVRYYWMLTDKIGIFPQFGITTSNNLDNFNDGTLSIGGNPNIVFFATKHLGINLGFGNLGYNLDYQTKTYNFNVNLNENISFGLNYYWK